MEMPAAGHTCDAADASKRVARGSDPSPRLTSKVKRGAPAVAVCACQVLEAWTRDDGSLPDYLSLVEMHSQHGALIGTDTTIRVRPLTQDRMAAFERVGACAERVGFRRSVEAGRRSDLG